MQSLYHEHVRRVIDGLADRPDLLVVFVVDVPKFGPNSCVIPYLSPGCS